MTTTFPNPDHEHWLIVGSSPSAARFDDVRTPAHRVVAVSHAIRQVPDCDVFVFKDKGSVRDHGGLIAAMIADDRPVVTTTDMQLRYTPKPPPPWWDDMTFIDVNPTTTFVRGEYAASKLSGPLALYWAINHGATEIDVVGFEGLVELQRGIRGGAYVEQARVLCAAAAGCADVTFRYYGELTWDIDGENVEVMA